jgi:site-specific DNA recombinase
MDVSLYLRLSEDAHGTELGIDRQLKECTEYADARGWRIVETFVDNDISATTGAHRPGFEALLESSPAAVLCWHLDRLLRVSGDLDVLAHDVGDACVEA